MCFSIALVKLSCALKGIDPNFNSSLNFVLKAGNSIFDVFEVSLCCFSTAAAPFHIPTNGELGSRLLHPALLFRSRQEGGAPSISGFDEESDLRMLAVLSFLALSSEVSRHPSALSSPAGQGGTKAKRLPR